MFKFTLLEKNIQKIHSLVVKWIVSSLTVQQEIEQFFDNFYDQPA